MKTTRAIALTAMILVPGLCLGARYAIVRPADASPPHAFAAEELQLHLRLALGEDVPVVDAAPDGAAVFELGTERAKDIVGRERAAALVEEESVYEVRDGTVAICGGGVNGLAYGVYTYLERELGARWYDADSEPVIRKVDKLDFSPRGFRTRPALAYRAMIGVWFVRYADSREKLFFFRNRLNHIGVNYTNVREDLKGKLVPRLIEISPGCHTFFTYLPPDPKDHRAGYVSDLEQGYFAAHPEWYSLSKDGKREPKQLCFANREMRRELTKNFLARLEKRGGKGFISLSAQDTPGALCHCDECRRVSEEHRSPGAPLYDYLIELGPVVKERFPEAIIHFLVYRKEQTQRPPVGFGKWPDNLAAMFAPIDDDISKTMTHPHNEETFRDFLEWTKMVKVWCWYYTYTYGQRGIARPGLARAVADTKSLVESGLTGAYYAFDVDYQQGINFVDALCWMMLQTYQDPNRDWRELRKEFFDYAYGAAADTLIGFSDWEERRQAEYKTYMTWECTFPGKVAPEEIDRWEAAFDAAEALVANDPKRLQRVREARYGLDFMAITAKRSPDKAYKRAKETLRTATDRRYPKSGLGPTFAARYKKILDETHFMAVAKIKPLPAEFDGIAADRIVTAFPNISSPKWCERVELPDAAAGFALRGLPRPAWKEGSTTRAVGVYDPVGKKFLFDGKIPLAAISRDRFVPVKVGTTAVPSERTFVWTSDWAISCSMSRCYVPGHDDRFDIWLSLKTDKDGALLCDRAIFVKVE